MTTLLSPPRSRRPRPESTLARVPRLDWLLVAVTAVLLVLGTLLVWSATAERDALRLQRFWHQLPIVFRGNAAVRLRQHHFDQAERRLEVRPLAVHLDQPVAFAARKRAVERLLDPQPGAEQQSSLRPGKLPWDRAQRGNA